MVRFRIKFFNKILILFCISILFSFKSNGQILKVLDSATKTILSNVHIKEQAYISGLNSNGTIIFKPNSKGKEITISHLGYLSKTFFIPNNDTTVYLSENIIRLGEVTIQNTVVKATIIGNYQKKGGGTFVNSSISKDINFTVVNKFNGGNKRIEAIFFYITKNNNYTRSTDIGPIEIVFYKENSNKLPHKEPYHKVLVNNYSIGWNKILVPDLAQHDEVLFYGIRWIFDPNKYHYKDNKYPFFGPKLGTISKKEFNVHQTFFFNAEFGWRQVKLGPAMLALEISN